MTDKQFLEWCDRPVKSIHSGNTCPLLHVSDNGMLHIHGHFIGYRLNDVEMGAMVHAIKCFRDEIIRTCCAAVRYRCDACDDGHSGDRHPDGTSIECMYCGVPIRSIRKTLLNATEDTL
jgi:hypothetical protein